MTSRQIIKFNNQMEKYREGIIQDLKNGRDPASIIMGYGFTFSEEYHKAEKWINDNIQRIPMPLDTSTDIKIMYEGKERKICTKCNTLVYQGKNWLGHYIEECNCMDYRRP